MTISKDIKTAEELGAELFEKEYKNALEREPKEVSLKSSDDKKMDLKVKFLTITIDQHYMIYPEILKESNLPDGFTVSIDFIAEEEIDLKGSKRVTIECNDFILEGNIVRIIDIKPDENPNHYIINGYTKSFVKK